MTFLGRLDRRLGCLYAAALGGFLTVFGVLATWAGVRVTFGQGDIAGLLLLVPGALVLGWGLHTLATMRRRRLSDLEF